jgi:hypothetical protein
MRALSAQEMLAVWERGMDRLPLERALALLEAACPESEPQALAALSIGRRDARLFTLREWAFGPRLTGCSACRNCGETLEVDLQVADLRQDADKDGPGATTFSIQGYELALRPVNSLDLVACMNAGAGQASRVLFARCLVAANSATAEITAGQIPDDVAELALEKAGKADPQAEMEIVLSCAACGQQSAESFDIVSFFWNEIDVWARRILREIHVLASAYGWRESEILELSPLRRQFYLDMAGA